MKYFLKYILIVISLFVIVGCSNDKPPEKEPEVSNESNEVASDISIRFGIIEVITKDDIIYVSGDVQTVEDTFYYIMEYGKAVIVEETAVAVANNTEEWQTFSFEISIKDEGLTNEETPFITFYGKDGQKKVNPHYVPVDLMIYD